MPTGYSVCNPKTCDVDIWCAFPSPSSEGDETDNPALDADDEGESNRETIFLARPHDGTYEILVHHFNPKTGYKNAVSTKGEGSTILREVGLSRLRCSISRRLGELF
jgi:hypothetical protein